MSKQKIVDFLKSKKFMFTAAAIGASAIALVAAKRYTDEDVPFDVDATDVEAARA